MKPMKLLIASCIASSVFTFYSAIQSGVYYNRFRNDSYYSNQPKFAEIGNLVDDAKTLIKYNKDNLAAIYLQSAEQKFVKIVPEQNISKFSSIDNFLREASVDLNESDCDEEYQLIKLDMVQDELDSLKKSYLSQSTASENLDQLSYHFRNTSPFLIVSSLLLLALSFAKKKQTIK